jgi:hypothetical protein
MASPEERIAELEAEVERLKRERYSERATGWDRCRVVIQQYAVSLWLNGREEDERAAILMRNMLLGKTRPTLVIREDSLGIPLPVLTQPETPAVDEEAQS